MSNAKISKSRLAQLKLKYPQIAIHGDAVLIEYALSKLEELDRKPSKRPELPNFLNNRK